MAGQVRLQGQGVTAQVALSHPGRLNALSRALFQPHMAPAEAQRALAGAYDYADAPGHRDGIAALLGKRKPVL